MLNSPKESPAQRLLRLQRKLFLSLKREIESKLGPDKKEMIQYQQEYEQDFAVLDQPFLKKQDLIHQLLDYEVILLSDFHTHGQSQKTALRLFKDILALSSERWALGLEMISSESQEVLNAFLADTISEKDFLRGIRYKKRWGMPWARYQGLILWAKSMGIPILALNRPQRISTQNELKARDQWAGGLIADWLSKENATRLFVLYGQWHVCSEHLVFWIQHFAQSLHQKVKIFCVHQNHDNLYWKIAPTLLLKPHLVAQINPDAACIFSITPWTQLKSLINYLESHPNPYETRETLSEPLDDAQRLASTVSQFFKMPKPSFENLNLYQIDSAEFVTFCDEQMTPSKLLLVSNSYRNDYPIYFFLGSTRYAYIRPDSFNQISELACVHLFFAQPANRKKSQPPFYLKILEFAFGFFGTSLLNPKRKCDLILDHREALAKLENGAKPLYAGEKKVRKSIIDFYDSGFALPEVNKKLRTLSVSRWMQCRYLGSLLGINLHHLVFSNKVTIETAQTIFFGIGRTHAKVRVQMLVDCMQKSEPTSKTHEF
jgi:hypothetical protein